MNRFRIAAVILILQFLPNTVDADRDRAARKAVVEVAKRQIELFEAKIRHDWDAMYAMLSPQMRKAFKKEDFKKYPHDLHQLDLIKMSEKGFNLSGARTDKSANREVRASGTRSHMKNDPNADEGRDPEEGKYLPIVLGYRFEEFHVSKNARMVKVVSKVTNPAFELIGPTISFGTEEEYWQKTNGQWYAEWVFKYIIHASGAKTDTGVPKINFVSKFEAKDIALDFFNKAKELPEGRQRTRAIDNALLLDTLAIVEKLEKEKVDAGDLPRIHIDRMMRGHLAYPRFFPSMMKVGYWYGLVGDYEASYKGYMRANKIDPNQERALEGASIAASYLGDYEKAARHYINFLKILSIRQGKPPPTLDRYLKGDCRICPKLRDRTKIDLARHLVIAGKWNLAFALYRNLVRERPGWLEVENDLKLGRKVSIAKIRETLGGSLSGELSFLTYGDLEKILSAGGIKLFHPGDFSGLPVKIKENIMAESRASFTQAGYSHGYSTASYPSDVSIKFKGGNVSLSSGGANGHAALFIRKGEKVIGRFYRDDNPGVAGNSKLADEIAELKEGDSVLLASISSGNVYIEAGLQAMLASIRSSSQGLSAEDDELILELALKHRGGSSPAKVSDKFLKALNSIGVDTSRVGTQTRSRIYFGKKGSRVGEARVWLATHGMKKLFVPSNLNLAKGARGPSITVRGNGDNATVTYRQ